MVGSQLLALGLLATSFASAELSRRDVEGTSTSPPLATCPGYKASKVKISSIGLTAELTLAGKACNVYGIDLKDLVLQVTYESGKCHAPRKTELRLTGPTHCR